MTPGACWRIIWSYVAIMSGVATALMVVNDVWAWPLLLWLMSLSILMTATGMPKGEP